MNFINNVFMPGPQSTKTEACILPEDPSQGTPMYLTGQYRTVHPQRYAEDQWLNVTFLEPSEGEWVEVSPAQAPRSGDADDLRVVAEIRRRSGQVGRGTQ